MSDEIDYSSGLAGIITALIIIIVELFWIAIEVNYLTLKV